MGEFKNDRKADLIEGDVITPRDGGKCCYGVGLTDVRGRGLDLKLTHYLAARN